MRFQFQIVDHRFARCSIVWLLLILLPVPSIYAASNNDVLLDLLGDLTACNLSKRLMADIQPQPLFQSSSGSCDRVTDDIDNVTQLFSDSACKQPFSYRTTSLAEYCLRTLDKEMLGNAQNLQATEPYWSLSPGNRYDLGALALAGVTQPYVSRIPYKSVDTAAGECVLEMRVYKSSPTATGLNSLIALHGGSWTSRGFGFFGLEMTVPHFTNAGFVVFAPFYRLLDSREGNTECNNASIEEIIADASDALEWVQSNAPAWGGNTKPAVFGQSAGAHLAAYLAVHQPIAVSNAVLLYPPTDFTDFAEQIRNGSYTNEQGLSILQRVIGGPAESIDLSASPIPENTFPAIVESDPDAFPPMFLLHGLADELVDARQAIRLCAALGGDVAAGEDANIFRESPELRHRVDCDSRGSSMHLFKEGQHALDVCPTDNLLLNTTCLSGSPQSKALVADSVRAAVNWAVSLAALPDSEQGDLSSMSEPSDMTTVSTGSGSGSLDRSVIIILLLMGLCRCARAWNLEQTGNNNNN